MWARMPWIALAKQGGDDVAFYQTKLATARFFFAKVLPQQAVLFQMIGAGKQTLMEMAATDF